jgi:hypothetical protein
MKLLVIISVDFDITYQLLSDFMHSSDTGEKREYNATVYQLKGGVWCILLRYING